MKFLDEFKAFIAKGNVVDMAVGVVVGTAFKSIVDSLVADILTPVLSLFTGRINIADLTITVSDKLVIPYGSFIQSIINFLIIAFSVFCMVKTVNIVKSHFEKQEEEKKPEPDKTEVLLTEIRDLLKNK